MGIINYHYCTEENSKHPITTIGIGSSLASTGTCVIKILTTEKAVSACLINLGYELDICAPELTNFTLSLYKPSLKDFAKLFLALKEQGFISIELLGKTIRQMTNFNNNNRINLIKVMAELESCQIRKVARVLYLGARFDSNAISMLPTEILSYIAVLSMVNDSSQALRKRFQAHKFFVSPKDDVPLDQEYKYLMNCVREKNLSLFRPLQLAIPAIDATPEDGLIYLKYKTGMHQ